MILHIEHVDGAMAAWDADPCSPAKANAVVERLNAGDSDGHAERKSFLERLRAFID